MTTYELYHLFLAFMFGTLFGLCIAHRMCVIQEERDCVEEETTKACSRCGQHKEFKSRQ